jgi:membrane protease YdiL (CAAX protease family)
MGSVRSPVRGPSLDDVAAAAIVVQPFTAYCLVLLWVAPPTEAQWQMADPILKLAPRIPTLWSVPLAGMLVAAGWAALRRPRRSTVCRGAREALLGAAVAIVATGAMRLLSGPSLPAFVPPEESAGPGLLLSMFAGYGEEIGCRLLLMPLLYFPLRLRTPRLGPIVAVVGTGLAFALWHAAGESAFESTYFLTRLLFPGALMSLVWLVSPAAIVVGHCVAHLLIPVLFVG